ncbi:MAG: hypothetical protein H0W28_13170, partial [Pyrinomonadaceae bacterium]|nr:hypothetical protein [Pyrinomonadaceae bacterium]
SSQFRIGVSGHTAAPADGPYGGSFGINGAISKLNSLGAKVYRGIRVRDDTTSGFGIKTIATDVDLLLAQGIDPVVGLMYKPLLQPDEATAYAFGFGKAKALATALQGKAVKYYEIGNELDLSCHIRLSASRGRSPSDYDTTKYNLCRGLVKGLIAGVKSVNPNAQVIVGSSGWFHWGYQLRLWRDGVRWDLSGFHWYSKFDGGSAAIPGTDFGGGYNIFDVLKNSFARPIVCTEFGANYSQFGTDDAARAAWLTRTMTEWKSISANYSFLFATVYEMLDEPQTRAGFEQQRIGIFTSTGAEKPQSRAVRAWISNDNSTSSQPPPPTPSPSPGPSSTPTPSPAANLRVLDGTEPL